MPDTEAPTDEEVRWSIDVALMNKQLAGEDHLQSTVRAHLYVDHVLIGILKLAMPRRNLVRFERLPMIAKAEIAAGIGAMWPGLLPAIKRLNQMRNSFAHRLHHAHGEADKRTSESSTTLCPSGVERSFMTSTELRMYPRTSRGSNSDAYTASSLSFLR